MKRNAKRMLTVLLCITMLAGALAVPLGIWAAGGEVSIQNGSGTRGAVQVSDSLAYRAKVNGAFTAFSFTMPTWSTSDSSCTLSLYTWKGSFDKTVAATPLASEDFDALVDNAVNTVAFPEQPAGEYLFYIGNVKGKAGVWMNTQVKDPKGFFYENGSEGRGEPELKITFTDIPAEPFGVCEPSVGTRVQQIPYTEAAGSAVTELNGSVGMLVDTAAPFVGVEFKLATYMVDDLQATFSVYKWQRDYDTTTSAAPVAEGRISLMDNAYQGITFEEQPAGKYLVLVHSASGTTAYYHYPTVKACSGVFYKDGYAVNVATPGYPQLRMTFTEDLGSEAYFLPVTAESDDVDGNHTPPAAYEIPADSLLNTHKVMPDTWVFTDGLGRVSLTNAEVGDPKADKTLAMFFWTWHLSGTANTPRNNLQKLYEQYPDAMRDYDHELWSTLSGQFAWNDSIYGAYRSDDAWVLRRQAELLANAGVDVIFTDNTNGTNTWRAAYTELMKVWDDAQKNGAVDVPKVSFMLPFGATDGSKQQLYALYLDVFRSGKYQNLWFYWDDKPMLMAHTSNLSATASNTEKEILNFFTFRANYPGYINNSPATGSWGWLSTYPQAVYYATRFDQRDGKPEQITVGVAQNHDAVAGALAAMSGNNIMGRSYTSKGYHTEEGAKLWGYNFSEQFDYALTVDPKVIFVTGWNEWTAGRYKIWPEGSSTAVENAFPDQFIDEYSRDIEPSKGDLQDHYYYLLVNYVRQYKGASAIPTPSEKTAIDMTAGSEQWQAVAPYYAAYIGNTDDRDAQGYGVYYTETSGRNDIIGAQVARDDEYVYFHVECAENITAYTDKLWMNLYIDATGDGALDGWNSFDYIVNKTAASEKTLVLEKFTGDGYASEKVADVEYTVDGRYMTVKIAKSDLGLSGDDYTINFSWTDNVHDEGDYETYSGDILDFYISGDVAPGGRFKYSYISTAQNAGGSVAPVESEEDESNTAAITPEAPADEGCGSSISCAALLLSACAAAVVLGRRKP